MKIIRNKTHYSLNKVSKMFGLTVSNMSLKNFLIENVPYVCIDGKELFDKWFMPDPTKAVIVRKMLNHIRVIYKEYGVKVNARMAEDIIVLFVEDKYKD